MKNDEKFENVCKFYATTHKLKNILRSGWVQWHIQADRIESVAEHVFGTQMLAFALNSEFELGLDIEKVVMMLAFHEIGEAMIGDITILDGVAKPQKTRMEWDAIEKELQDVKDKELVWKLFSEFDENKTREARFCKHIDHFESNMQIKFHQERGDSEIVEPVGEEAKKILSDPKFADCKNLAEIWIKYHRETYDELFKEFADYILSHDVF